MTGGGWMNSDQRDSVRGADVSVADVIKRVRERLPKWRVWFPDDGSMVEIPRRELMALVAAAEQRDELLAAALKAEPIVAAMCNALGETCQTADAESLYALRDAIEKGGG
jgi:hypothetical protein